MSRLSSSNLFGNLYDPDRNKTSAVFNQNPTGRSGQASSFAAAQQAARDKESRQRQEAMAAAEAQNQAVIQEAQAADQRREQAQAQAFREQEFKLQEARFNNDKAVDAQKLEEARRAAAATEAFQQNQNRLSVNQSRGANPLNELRFGSLTSSGSNNAPMGTTPGNILLNGRKPGRMIHNQLGITGGSFGGGRASAFGSGAKGTIGGGHSQYFSQ